MDADRDPSFGELLGGRQAGDTPAEHDDVGHDPTSMTRLGR